MVYVVMELWFENLLEYLLLMVNFLEFLVVNFLEFLVVNFLEFLVVMYCHTLHLSVYDSLNRESHLW